MNNRCYPWLWQKVPMRAKIERKIDEKVQHIWEYLSIFGGFLAQSWPRIGVSIAG